MPMKSTNALLSAAVVTALSGAGFVPTVSVASDTVSIEQAENANAWFVQLRSKPMIEGGKATALAKERTNLEAALKAGYGPTIRVDAVKKLVDAVSSYQERSMEIIQEMRVASTRNADEIRTAVEEGKQRLARLAHAAGKLPEAKNA